MNWTHKLFRQVRLLSMLCLLASPAAQAQIYKCPDPSGKTVYQDSPCDGSVRRTIPSEAQEGSQVPGPRSGPLDSEVRFVLLMYKQCTSAFPVLVAKVSTGYYQWRSKQGAAITRVEASAEYASGLKLMEQGLKDLTKGHPSNVEKSRDECDAFLSRIFLPVPKEGPTTPLEAWSRFTAALRGGDVEKALSFVTPEARSRYRSTFTGTKDLRQQVDELGEMQTMTQAGKEIAFGTVLRPTPDGKKQIFEIGFIRDRHSGFWFIDSM